MIASLYEPFKTWSEKGSVWLISDPHFNDSDTKFMNPNWIEPEDYIQYINKTSILLLRGAYGRINKGHLE